MPTGVFTVGDGDRIYTKHPPLSLIETCRQWVFVVGNGDRIYTKHPPLPPADVIRRDVRDVATVVLCERV